MNIHVGARFRAIRDVEVTGVVSFSAPFSVGCGGTLPAGAVVVIEQVNGSHAVYARPEAYAALEERLVAKRDRTSPAYDSYSLAIDVSTLGSAFEKAP